MNTFFLFHSFFLHTATVWIIGDSYVRRAAKRAAQTMGHNLSVPGVHVCWFGWGGLRWKGFLPFFSHSLRGRTAPDILIIHCGGNDMGDVRSVELVNMMKEDVHHLRQQHPGTFIMFSALTPRCQWRASVANPGKLDKSRRFVNSVMATFVQSLNGAMIEQPLIKHDSPGLYLKDGVHLTPKGNDIL